MRDINYEFFSNDNHPLERRMPPPELSTKQIEAKMLKKHAKPMYLSNYIKAGEQMITTNEIKDEEPEVMHNDILPEYLNWAVSANGISSCR